MRWKDVIIRIFIRKFQNLDNKLSRNHLVFSRLIFPIFPFIVSVNKCVKCARKWLKLRPPYQSAALQKQQSLSLKYRVFQNHFFCTHKCWKSMIFFVKSSLCSCGWFQWHFVHVRFWLFDQSTHPYVQAWLIFLT